ncbi:MAG TPA: hypothetical protein DDZ51_06545, partial [Planctomycetaceae bacterium]|nr:hypothetical protein [Planctomycetaceae bacterium]
MRAIATLRRHPGMLMLLPRLFAILPCITLRRRGRSMITGKRFAYDKTAAGWPYAANVKLEAEASATPARGGR